MKFGYRLIRKSPVARRKKKFAYTLRRHFKFKKNIYLGVILVLGVIIGGMWAAQSLMNKEEKHFEDVAAMSGSSEDKYQEALLQVKDGDLEQARTAMLRLARMGDDLDNPLGFGKAHLWVAKDKLGRFSQEFIEHFPAGSNLAEKGRSTLPDNSNTVSLIGRHLEHAVALNPELGEASALLAAIYAAQGKRNESLGVLINAITHETFPHPDLHIALANVLTMSGEDSALEVNALHQFSTLGQTVHVSRGVEVPVRVRYVISALLLKKTENAEAVIRRMEAQYSVKRRRDKDLDSVEAIRRQVTLLRMAFHYHQALRYIKGDKSAVQDRYKLATDELEKALKTRSDCQAAVEALTWIAAKSTDLRVRVRSIIKESSLASEEANEKSKTNTSLAIALSMDASDPSRKKYLEAAVKETPESAKALGALAEQLLLESKPDHKKVEDLATDALKYSEPEGRYHLYKILGLSQLKQAKWRESVISLEKSLGGIENKAEVHAWLADAYLGLGQTKLANSHRALSAE